jgi:hypothetical protein
MFLIHKWNALMKYDPDKSLDEAAAKDNQFTEFFRNIKAFTRNL